MKLRHLAFFWVLISKSTKLGKERDLCAERRDWGVLDGVVRLGKCPCFTFIFAH